MSEPGATAQPGISPAVDRTAGTMFAALYGELTPHPWRAPKQDADALFHDRSLAMGWLDDRSTGQPGSAPGLWAVDDAGWHHPGGLDKGLVAWFQVEASAVAHNRPLPVRPFLGCARDTVGRAGTLRLSAVQVLLPVHGLDPSSRPPYAPVPAIRTTQWYADTDSHARTPVRVSVDGGRDRSVVAVAEQLVDQFTSCDQEVFADATRDVAGDVADSDAVPPPPFDDSLWNGPPGYAVALRGTLAEWSCDAVGWLAEVVADRAANVGVRSPLLLTVTRAGTK
ncbi:hypothetical protein O7632_27845 [Solwaraspora sp. WMMD406]|uniref:hypothetical protein n=1 Tax=Solwaraspora sp. WMMD406 TaxID=3016095 RepID=UPI002416D339|nr:hypothetical protein [Solwaraspora sp. WMMD406]MDG4767878.1 hypothetical protein [Solwaraspora sp. WMMD406]